MLVLAFSKLLLLAAMFSTNLLVQKFMFVEGLHDRNCKCNFRAVMCENPNIVVIPETNPITEKFNIQVNDTKDLCDFRCNRKCEKEIRDNIDEIREQICNVAFPNKSINRGGICIESVPELDGGCTNNKKEIIVCM